MLVPVPVLAHVLEDARQVVGVEADVCAAGRHVAPDHLGVRLARDEDHVG